MSNTSSQHPTALLINQLQTNPLQPRGKIKKEDLEELARSIKAYGVLEPIVVAHTPAGYQIIAGERRWRAAQLAGLKEVPVVVKVTTPKGMLEMALIENVQRVDLSPLERAQAFQQLIRDFRFTNAQLSERVGKSNSYITNTLRLLDLPDAIKDGLMGGLITEGHARALCSIPNERTMIDCYKVILKENSSVRQAEDLARRYKERFYQNIRASHLGKSAIQSPIIDKWQAALQSVFPTKKTEVKLTQSARQTKVVFLFKGPPEQTQTQVEKLLKITEENPE